MKKTLQISNGIAFVVMVVINYLANTGVFNNNTVGSVSAQYENLFTPAGYAFSIWGIIYLGLLGFILYQGRSLFSGPKKGDEVTFKIGWWFVISCFANCLWILTWLFDYIGISVLIMLLLLFSLSRIIINTRMELDDVPLSRIALLWWPFSLYSGWITIALIANIAAYLTKIGWDRFGISEVVWTVIMIFVAGVVNLVIAWTRNMREFALVGAWGLIAVAVNNWNQEPVVKWAAFVVAGILLISSGFHAYKNRKKIPFRR